MRRRRRLRLAPTWGLGPAGADAKASWRPRRRGLGPAGADAKASWRLRRWGRSKSPLRMDIQHTIQNRTGCIDSRPRYVGVEFIRPQRCGHRMAARQQQRARRAHVGARRSRRHRLQRGKAPIDASHLGHPATQRQRSAYGEGQGPSPTGIEVRRHGQQNSLTEVLTAPHPTSRITPLHRKRKSALQVPEGGTCRALIIGSTMLGNHSRRQQPKPPRQSKRNRSSSQSSNRD